VLHDFLQMGSMIGQASGMVTRNAQLMLLVFGSAEKENV
jgi:hypothetical protein